jgi:ADP-ribose pyrophosphatase
MMKSEKNVKKAPAKTKAPAAVKAVATVASAKAIEAVRKAVKPGAVKPEQIQKQKPLSKKKVAASAGYEAAHKQVQAKKVKALPEKKTSGKAAPAEKAAKILDSKIVYEGPLFRVFHDHLIEPDGTEANRDVIRHNGSVVILAVDPGKKKKDPWVVIERQYRHAAGQYLWELPAGKLDAGETPIEGAKRELSEETGYKAKKWSPLVEYFASPGFLGEAMKVFLAEGLIAGEATPEEDEHIDFRLVKLSEILEQVDKGKIIDGKTLTTVLLYARQLGIKR